VNLFTDAYIHRESNQHYLTKSQRRPDWKSELYQELFKSGRGVGDVFRIGPGQAPGSGTQREHQSRRVPETASDTPIGQASGSGRGQVSGTERVQAQEGGNGLGSGRRPAWQMAMASGAVWHVAASRLGLVSHVT
jgi:hypothetical protein